MECTCHLGAPPCGYCVEGTEDYREALGFAEMLDDRELERLYNDIIDIIEARGEKLTKKQHVKAVVEKAATAPPVQAAEPVTVEKGPDIATSVERIKANVRFAVRAGKAREAYRKAEKTPINKGLWDTCDRLDAEAWAVHIFGPKFGDGAQWDNRRKAGVR